MKQSFDHENPLLESLSIGIDIGGTNTDAVLLQANQIKATFKTPTTADVKQGVINAITGLLQLAALNPMKIDSVMMGTTHFVNTVLQAKGLNQVLVIRLAAPASTALPPLAGWPEPLYEAVGKHCEIIKGGYEYNGQEIAPLDRRRLIELASLGEQHAIKAVAITGVFANLNPTQENEAAALLCQQLPGLQVSLSHKIGGLDLLMRENATVLNAALSAQFQQLFASVKQAMADTGLSHATLFFSSNDGTLEAPEDIFPIATYGSGPSNSIRGAAVLAKLEAAIVADIGGTSTDVGILKNGFPLDSGQEINVGEGSQSISCNFTAPLVFTIALGGGSIIDLASTHGLTIRPASVAYRLMEEAISFGGNTLTVTDVAIAKGRLALGELSYLKSLTKEVIEKADEEMHVKLADAIHQVLPFIKEEMVLPLILVGGGASLFDRHKLSALLAGKVDEIIVPEYAANANALGAAVAKVSGTYHGIYQYTDTNTSSGTPRDIVLCQAIDHATYSALAKGAEPATIQVQALEELPINYLPGNQTEVRVKVIVERKTGMALSDKLLHSALST